MTTEVPPHAGVTLYRAMSWMSPAWPIGAFAYSSGLEWAHESGWLKDRSAVETWVRGSLREGALACDAAIFARAWLIAGSAEPRHELAELAELAAAAQTSAERELESSAQGSAFHRIAIAANAALHPAETERFGAALAALDDRTLPYPLVAGVLFASFGIPLELALPAFLHAGISNLASAAQRIVPLGHTAAQQLIATLADEAQAATAAAIGLAEAPLEELVASASPAADIATMRHETQYTRLFRT